MTTRTVYVKKAFLIVVVIGLIAVYGFLIVNRPDESPQAWRVRLLCETDHEALLQAGREMLSKAPKDLMRYVVGRPVHIDGIPASRITPIPRVIRKLRPYAVLINLNGYIVLHMQEGLSNYGVKIYPEGFSRPSRDFRFGNRELLPGLWYYDYRYGHDPQYNSIIDQILQTGKWPKGG